MCAKVIYNLDYCSLQPLGCLMKRWLFSNNLPLRSNCSKS